MNYVADVMQNIKDPRAVDADHSGPCVTYRKCSNIIYDYNTFKIENIVFAKSPVAATQGELLYMNYKHTPQTRDFLKINTPTLFSPTGVTMMNDKPSTMLSLGKNWQDDPDTVAFKDIIDAITLACAHVILQRNWVNVKRDVTLEEVIDAVRPIIYVGKDKEGNDYAPALGAVVGTTKSCHSSFILRREDMSVTIPPCTVSKGSWITSVLHIRWIHRRPRSDMRAYPLGCSFSINVVIFNAVVHPKEEAVPDDVCVVQFKNDPLTAQRLSPTPPAAIADTTSTSCTVNSNPPPIVPSVSSAPDTTQTVVAPAVQAPQTPPPHPPSQLQPTQPHPQDDNEDV